MEKGERGMSRSKAGASEYARWCREVGIQIEVSVESTPPVRGGSDASIPLNANETKFKGKGGKVRNACRDSQNANPA